MYKKFINGRWFYRYFLMVVVILLCPLVIMAMFNRPIADDYGVFSNLEIMHPLNYAYSAYTGWSGKMSAFFVNSVLYVLFKKNVVIFSSLLLLFALILASSFVSFVLIRKFIKNISIYKIFVVGFFLSLISILSSPNLFDTYLWWTSSTVYIPSLIGLYICCGYAIVFSSKMKKGILEYLFLSLIIFFFSFFSEIADIVLVVIFSLLSFFTVIFYKKYKQAITYVVSFFISLFSLLIYYFSPGLQARVTSGNVDFAFSKIVFTNAFFDLFKMGYLLCSFRLFLVIVFSILLFTILPKIKFRKALFISLSLGFLVFSFTYLFFILMEYAGYIPERAYLIPSTIILISISFVVAILIKSVQFNIEFLLRLIGLIMSLLLIYFTYIYYKPIIYAVVIRSEAYDLREFSVEQQLKLNKHEIELEQLPILINSGASDLLNNDDTNWLNVAFKAYYGIPNEDKLVFLEQSKTYCVNDSKNNPYWTSVLPCSELLTF